MASSSLPTFRPVQQASASQGMLLSEHAKLLSFIWNSHQNLSSSITELLGLDSPLPPVQSPAASPSASFGAYILHFILFRFYDKMFVEQFFSAYSISTEMFCKVVPRTENIRVICKQYKTQYPNNLIWWQDEERLLHSSSCSKGFFRWIFFSQMPNQKESHAKVRLNIRGPNMPPNHNSPGWEISSSTIMCPLPNTQETRGKHQSLIAGLISML